MSKRSCTFAFSPCLQVASRKRVFLVSRLHHPLEALVASRLLQAGELLLGNLCHRNEKILPGLLGIDPAQRPLPELEHSRVPPALEQHDPRVPERETVPAAGVGKRGGGLRRARGGASRRPPEGDRRDEGLGNARVPKEHDVPGRQVPREIRVGEVLGDELFGEVRLPEPGDVVDQRGARAGGLRLGGGVLRAARQGPPVDVAATRASARASFFTGHSSCFHTSESARTGPRARTIQVAKGKERQGCPRGRPGTRIRNTRELPPAVDRP